MLLQLPFEMTEQVLTTLPYADLARFRSVSKESKRLADHVRGPVLDLLSTTRCSAQNTIVPDRIFRYQQSLENDNDVLYWSQPFKDPFQSTVRSQMIKRFKKVPRQDLTLEQRRIVETEPGIRGNEVVMVQAYAGTGKTTTLFRYAQRWPDKKMLYLAYNKVLADESTERFASLSNVHVTTIHALALQHMPHEQVGNLSLKHVQEILQQRDLPTCRAALSEFERYCSSDTLDDPTNAHALALWNATDHKVAHDAYLKAFQRSRPTLAEYDVILLDEVQDCTDCILNLVMHQTHATRLFVGDVYQKIYGFRHVGNPFQYITEKHRPYGTPRFHYLSVSFRFGYDLMELTNLFLWKKYNERKGFSMTQCASDTRLEWDDAYFPGMVVLCRYNINVMKLMFDLSLQERHVCALGKHYDFDKEIRYAQALLCLRNGEHTDVSKVCAFATLQDLYEHYSSIQNTKWKNRVSLMETYGDAIVDLWTQAKTYHRTHDAVFITTAHQSKGSEYDHVRLHDDFQGSSEDAHNTLYVAMTRAKKTLYLNANLFRFFDKHTAKLRYMFDTRHIDKRLVCAQCKRRSTNRLVCSENDPVSRLRGLECELFEYVPICSICHY